MADDLRILEIRAVLANAGHWTSETNPAAGNAKTIDRIRAIVDRESNGTAAQVRVFRYVKSHFKPVEQLPIYRVYPDGHVTRQQHGDRERSAGEGALVFVEEEVNRGRMAEVSEVSEASRG